MARSTGSSDDDLAAAIPATTIFARVGPDQKSRLIKIARRTGADVAFLGDGVNDAVALHAADVGISVDSATEVAKDAADIVLLDKDLGVLADGVREGRRIFANTLKYVLMATSSNFGNMFSAAGASLFLSFLPMLPSQILLNNLLYDVGQMAIPSDRVDPEAVARPAAWDIGFVRKFMMVFGPVSSIFDFATFFVMLVILNAGHSEFRSGWFVESLATQTLVIFVIRTRRVPFLRSRPSRADDRPADQLRDDRRRSCPSHRSRHARLRRATARLLPDPARNDRRVSRPRRARQGALLRGSRAAAPAAPDQRGEAAPPHPPPRAALHSPRAFPSRGAWLDERVDDHRLRNEETP